MTLRKSLLSILAWGYFSAAQFLSAQEIYVPPFDGESKEGKLGTELPLALGQFIADGLAASGYETHGAEGLKFTLQSLGCDYLTGYKRKAWVSELLPILRGFAPAAWVLTGTWRLEGDRLIVVSELRDVAEGVRRAAFTNAAEYPGELLDLVGEICQSAGLVLRPGQAGPRESNPAAFRQPDRYAAVRWTIEATRDRLADRMEGSNGALADIAKALEADALFLPAVRLELDLVAERSRLRERDGFEDPVSNLEELFARGLDVLKGAPGHGALNRGLAALAMNLDLPDVAWNFLLAAQRRDRDAAYERLFVRFARLYPARFGGADALWKIESESQKRIAKSGEKDLWYWLDQARLHRLEGSRNAKAGLGKSAKRSYANAHTALKAALGIASENPWVFMGLTEYYLDPDNNNSGVSKLKALDVIQNAIRFSYERIPAVLYLASKAYLANGERSRAFWALDKTLALSKRADYRAALEQLKKTGTLP
jgi:hypothetical protein